MPDVYKRMSPKVYLAVGVGGMIGAIGRYSISFLFNSNAGFPYATLTVNLIGCFLLSFLVNDKSIKQRLAPSIFTAFGTGIIGAFTTFSTFAVETIELWDTNALIAISYIFLSVCGGLFCCYGGYKLATRNQVA